MRRNRIQKPAGITGSKRFTVSDVPDSSTPGGSAKNQDEFRKLAMELNDFVDDIEGRIGGDKGPAATPDASTSAPPKQPPAKFPDLQVWQDGNKIVVNTTIWDFFKSEDIEFKVTQQGNGHAIIQAYTKPKPSPLNVMWGINTGGYDIQIPNSGTMSIPKYGGNVASSAPWRVEKARTLLHFIGDSGLFEPADSAVTRTGFLTDKPALEAAVWTSKTAAVNVMGEVFDVSTIKVRVTPRLQILGDPSRSSTGGGELSSETLTRIQFFDTDTTEVHVYDHPDTAWGNAAKVQVDVKDNLLYAVANVGSGAGLYKDATGTRPKTFNFKTLIAGANVSFVINDNDITINSTGGGGSAITYTAANLGSAGSNKAAVYSTTVGTEFKFRRIQGGTNVTVTESTDYVTIDAVGNVYNVANVGSGAGLVWKDTTGSNPYSINLRTIKAGAGITVTNNTSDITIDAYDVSGLAYGICSVAATPYNFYVDTVVNNTLHTTQLRMRNFGVVNDLFLTACAGGGYLLDVNVTLENLGTGYQISTPKSYVGTNTQLHARTLTPGFGVTMAYGGTSDYEIIISANPATLKVRNVGKDTGEIYLSTRYGGYVESFGTVAIAGGPYTDGKYYRATTGGSGTGLTVLIIVTAGVPVVHIVDPGQGYTAGDHIFPVGFPYIECYGTVVNNTNSVINLKTLSVSGDMFVSQTDYDITYHHTVDTLSVAGADTSIQKTIRAGKTSSNGDVLLGLKSLVAGSGITLTADATTVTITCTVTPNVYNMANVGTGEGHVWRNTTGSNPYTFNLKTIKAGAGISVVDNADDITISCTLSVRYYDADNVGGQTIVYRDKSGTGTIGDPVTFHFKTLQAGLNVNFTGSTTDKIVINAEQPTVNIYNMANVGTGAGHVWRNTTGSNPYTFNLKTIKAGAGITVTDNADDITISCDITDTIMYYDADNVGGQTIVYRDKSGTGAIGDPVVFHFKTLQAGSNIDFSGSTADKIVINSSYINNTYQMANVGTGEGHVWRNTTGTFPQTFNLKTVKAGAFIYIDDNADDITINTWDITAATFGACSTLAAPYNFYESTQNNSTTHTRELRFRNFNCTDDLFLTECPLGAYIMSVNVMGENLGTGYEVYDGKYYVGTQTHLKLRSFTPGDGISMDYDVTNEEIVISCLVEDTNDTYEFVNDGTGAGKVYKSVDTVGSVNTVHLRSIQAGSYITVTNGTNDIVIAGYAISGATTGACAAISTPYNFYVNTDTNTTAHTTTLNFRNWGRANDLFVTECLGGGYVLDVNIQGNNLGSGAGVYFNKTYSSTVAQVNLRSISAGAGIDVDISLDDSEIIISSTVVDTNDTYTFDNVGTGTGAVYRDMGTTGEAHVVHLKTIKAGTGINITNGTSDITITCVVTDTNTTYNFNNVGTGSGTVYRNVVGTGPVDVYLKSIKAGTGITVTNNADDITIDCTLTARYYTVDPDGGFHDILNGISGTGTIGDPVTFHFKTIKAGPRMLITDIANGIEIAGDVFWVHSNLGTGHGVYASTANTGTAADPYDVRFKSLKAGTNITLTPTSNDITITCDAVDHTYSGLNIGDGEYVYKSATLTGLNTVFRFKTIKAGAGVSVVSDVDDKVIVISSNMQVKATGLTQSNVGIIEFVDNLYDTTWVPDFATAGTAKLTPQFQNYNTKHDFAHFIDSGTKVTGKTVADNTWEHLWFDNEVIADTPGYVNKGETNTIPWLFKPSDDVNFNWRVVLHLGIVGCMPTDNARAAVIKFPELALFKGETYWDTISVDELVGAYGELRAYLMISDPFLGGAVPEAGSKSYLQGSDTVYLEDNSAELNVRFRHQTGQDVYVKLVKGSISITKVGMRCSLGADAQEVPYDFSSF